MRLFLVDGSAYVFRAYHALPALTRKSDGMPVGAVAGYCNMLYKLICDAAAGSGPAHFAVIFDHPAKTFRHDIYPEYKANRPPPPEDLRPQFDLVRKATAAFGVPCVEKAGYEADDIIATYARKARDRDGEVVIVSSDKDLMQLVGERVCMFDPAKNRRIGPAEVVEKFGLGPESVADIQALAGDASDNVPGVPGIGIKTAAQLIDRFGDLETLLSRTGEITQKKRRENLSAFADSARISKQLVMLKTDVPLAEDPENFPMRPPEPEKLHAFLEEMEFRTLQRRVAADAQNGTARPASTQKPVYETVTGKAALEKWIARARERGIVAVDTETDSLDPLSARLAGISLATDAGKACYIPVGHRTDDDTHTPEQMPPDTALALLAPLLEDPSVMKIGQNMKYDMLVLSGYGINIAPFEDTMLMSYALDCGKGRHGMDELAERHLAHETVKFSDVAGTGKNAKTFDMVSVEQATHYAAEDADITLRLYRTFSPRLAGEGRTALYRNTDIRLVPVLAGMERAGIRADRSVLARLSEDFSGRIEKLEATASDLAGEPFNPASPSQVVHVLFEKLGLPGGRKTPKGAWSTRADILERLAADGHALPAAILEWRALSKLKSTYTDALQNRISPDTGRIHTSFSCTTTLTGRLASKNPNLQNIPVRTDDGRKIRTAFIPEEGNILVSADYSQIELRLLACIAGLETMQNAFRNSVDIHALTASEISGCRPEEVDPALRRRAKAINFGIVYGISAFGLAAQLGITRAEAAAYMERYFEKFPGIRQYMDRMTEFARRNGYVESVFGRRMYIEGINDKSVSARNYAGRQAVNAPVQGAASDLIRRAMIRIPPALEKACPGTKMLLQVHDELVLEAPEHEADEACALVARIMRDAARPVISPDVPFEVDVRRGKNWGEIR